MRKIKIVEGFYDVKRVSKVVREQKKIVKGMKLVEAEVKIEDAHAFYMRNEWFRKQLRFKRRPVPGEKMVVVFYNDSVVEAVVKKVIRKTVKKVKVDEKEIALKEIRSLFAAQMPTKSEKRRETGVSIKQILRIVRSIICGQGKEVRSIALGDVRYSPGIAA